MGDTAEQVQRLIREAPPEVQEVVAEVLRLEREKLHLKLPRGINDDIADVVRKIVK